MNKNPYIKPGGISLFLHGILILAIIFGGRANLASLSPESPVEVDFEAARLIYAPSITVGAGSGAASGPQLPGGGGSPAASSPEVKKAPAAKTEQSNNKAPSAKIEQANSKSPSLKPVETSTKPPALPGEADKNSAALASLIGDNGGPGAQGNGTGHQDGGGQTGGGSGSNAGQGNGSGSRGHGRDGAGDGGGGDSGAGSRYQPKPDYPPAARHAGHQGLVIVRIRIDKQGIPSSVTVLKSSGYPELDQAAVTGVKRWRYSPARRNGQPVACYQNAHVNFCLDDV